MELLVKDVSTLSKTIGRLRVEVLEVVRRFADCGKTEFEASSFEGCLLC
jgi:hypothetical protein